jgi:hypothetical protein
MSYYVQDNNWTTAVTNSATDQKGASYSYPIAFNAAYPDQAPGCTSQSFFATYKCGNDATVRTIPTITNAVGKSANFNCTDLYTKCSSLTLNLGDDGILTVEDPDGVKLWNSTTDPNIKATPIVAGAAIALDAYKPTATTMTDPNMAYNRSYLKSGEYLNVGQYIGSPNGTCRLEMVTTSDNKKQLQVVYNSLGCSDLQPINSESSRLYTIPWTYRANLGNMGYVNNFGELQQYKDPAMTPGYSATFSKLANTDGTTYGMYGGNLGSPISNTPDVATCQTKCSTEVNCVGFEYEKVGKTCQLKGVDAIKNGIRYNNPKDGSVNYEYYSRIKSLNGVDNSCPSDANDIVSGETDVWKDMPTGELMTTSTKCGLMGAVENKRKLVQVVDASLNKVANSFSGYINNLYTKYETLKNSLLNNETTLASKFNELTKSKKDLADWSDEQSQQLDAMNEDRDLNMMSQNYKHIMWSILAIIIIIGIIKFTKSFGGEKIAEIAKKAEIPNPLASLPT